MSSLAYIEQIMKVIVAQITQTIGWQSIQSTPLELVSDLLQKYLTEITRQTQRYSELYGRTEPNLDDVALAFNDLNINIADLEEYITNVDSVPCIVNVPKFPIPKESNLNFLKPGSKEVVTRPVHIHEHLPPIQPHEETPPAEVKPAEPSAQEQNNSTNLIQTYMSTNQISDNPTLNSNGVFEHETHDDGSEAINVIAETTVIENHTNIPDDETTFRKPFDAPPASSKPAKTAATNKDAIGKPTREIISCFMTTGGFISPAREGKLPDAKKPIIIMEDPEPEPIETKPPTPTPEPIERKHHSNKRENKNENMDTSKNYANDMDHIDGAYANDGNGNGKEVKLYEVIQTVPDALTKKKTKKSQPDGAQVKGQKKLKKINQLKANRNQMKMSTSDGPHSFSDAFNRNDASNMLKKKFNIVKKKTKKQLDAMQLSTNENPLAQQKQHKKRMSKLSKKNLQAMGLNPNAIEGFAIPPPLDAMNYSMHDTSSKSMHEEEHMRQKESIKKMKQLQKLSTEPDKQKIKFFKKLSSTSSNLLSKSNEDPHDRSMVDLTGPNDSNMSVNQYSGGLDYQDTDAFNLSGGMKMTSPNLDNLPPNKKMKLLKKLNKPPKEPKTPKIKKLKKDPLLKKQRTPKTPKLLDQPIDVPKMPPSLEENALTKMFRLDQPNVGLNDQFMPGLNPMNPLFQSVRFDFAARDQMQNYPFGFAPGNIDFANLTRFKRPNFSDHTQNDPENLSKHSHEPVILPAKPFCNVAPLMPPSLLNMEMHPKDEYAQNPSINEPHSSQKHYQDIGPNTSFAPKKSVSFQTPEPYSDQSYGTEKREYSNSPIVINSDDDERHRSTASQSPNPEQGGGGEVKRKKVKDKKDKEKKEKKDKETGVVKIKKKKDKKDKSKNKGEHSKSPKDKAALKKEKREKKKERERSAAGLLDVNDGMGAAASSSNSFYSQSHSEWPRDAFSKDLDHSQMTDRSDLNASFQADNSNSEVSIIPKLTLKLSSSSPSSRTSRPSTPDFPVTKKSSKKKKKHWRTLDDDSELSEVDDNVGSGGKLDEPSEQLTRESSPELARISALITRPPKQKSSIKQQTSNFGSPVQNDYIDASTGSRSDYHSSISNTASMSLTPSGRGRPKGSNSLKGSKSKSSKASVSFSTNDSIKKFDNSTAILDAQANVVHTVDEQTNEENQVWICPACGRVDDGTPMIGCDGCDDWYHWVCVGILVPPNEDQDWFCRVCISRKQEDKKKKRKKKDKKDH